MGMEKKKKEFSHPGMPIGANNTTIAPKKRPIDIHTSIGAGRFRLPDGDSPTSDSCEMELISPADTSNVSPAGPVELEVVLTGCDGVDRVEFMLDNFDYQLSGIDYFQTGSASAPPYSVILPAPPPGDAINAWATAFDDDESPSYVTGLSFHISTTVPNKPGRCELRIISIKEGVHYPPGSPQSAVIGVKGCSSMTKIVLATHGSGWGTKQWVLTDKQLCPAHGSIFQIGGSKMLSGKGERSYCLNKPQWQPPEASDYHRKLYANAWEKDNRLLGQTSVKFYVDHARAFDKTLRLP